MTTQRRSLYDMIAGCADVALETQRDDGSMPPGHNGPRDDPETPVRNTGHWAITFIHCHDHTGDERYLDAAESAIAYLQSGEARPQGVTFHHRKSSEKDRCNGLIGQAWTIEALATAGEYLDRLELVELASEVFLQHPFERNLAAWHPVEIDDAVRPIDMTFNHQLWFAAAGGLLTKHTASDPIVDEQVTRYLNELEANLNVMDRGLVYHPFKPDFDVKKYGQIFIEGVKAGTAHTMIAGVLRGLLGSSDQEDDSGWTKKAIGYHSFNLYAFALLREAYPDHAVWDSPKIKDTLAYATSETYVDDLDGNPYGYPYNCSGIEAAYALNAFDQINEQELSRWLDRQFSRTYNPGTKRMGRNNPDPTTLTARLYEATRLPNVQVTVPMGRDDE